MFNPRRGPVKEGRTHPGLPFGGSSATGRSRLTQRQAGLLIVVLVFIPLMYFFTHVGGPNLPIAAEKTNWRTGAQLEHDLKSGTKASSDADDVLKVDLDEEKPIRDRIDVVKDDSKKPASVTATAKSTGSTTVNDDDDDDDEVVPKKKAPKLSESTRKHNSGPHAEKWAERPSFEKALSRIIDLLPDEVIMRELTRTVESTGKERLREMGLRTRSFKKYFDAWEALHLAEDEEGSTYVRDDVVQYLRSHSHNVGADTGFNEEGGLAGMSLAQTIRAYESYRTFMINYAHLLFPWTAPYFSDHMSLHAHFKKGGRGIVLTAGDDQAPYLLTTIWSFRKLGYNLPIEVMYLGDQDLGEDYRQELEALHGEVTRDIAQMTNDEGWKLAGWAAKPFAILLSSFREVIFIDADSLFFRNPALLFEEPGYKKTGALFFKDRLIMPESKKRWLQQILPKPIPKLAKQTRFWSGESGHQQESGVVVIDKWQHFISLLLITRMNGPDRDGKKEQGIVGVYDMVYGDKETFWVGFLLAGDESYHFHEGDAGIMGVVKTPQEVADRAAEKADGHQDHDDDDKQEVLSDKADREVPQDHYTICAPQLLHLDKDGKPYWFNGWLLHNKFADRSKKRFANFESYLIEPNKMRDPGAWELADSNMCCLTTDADKKFDFSGKDKETLTMIMDRAHEIGAYGNQ